MPIIFNHPCILRIIPPARIVIVRQKGEK